MHASTIADFSKAFKGFILRELFEFTFQMVLSEMFFCNTSRETSPPPRPLRVCNENLKMGQKLAGLTLRTTDVTCLNMLLNATTPCLVRIQIFENRIPLFAEEF